MKEIDDAEMAIKPLRTQGVQAASSGVQLHRVLMCFGKVSGPFWIPRSVQFSCQPDVLP